MGRSQPSAERKRYKVEQNRLRYDDPLHTSIQARPTLAMRRRYLAARALRVPVDRLHDEYVERFFAHIEALRSSLAWVNRPHATRTSLEYLEAYFFELPLPTEEEIAQRFGLDQTSVSDALQRLYELLHKAVLRFDPDLVREAQSNIAETDVGFWDRVEKSADPNGCWMWKGGTDQGYGFVKRGGKKMQAHRYAYSLAVGETTPGLFIYHTCRVRKCVNPGHLFEGKPGMNDE